MKRNAWCVLLLVCCLLTATLGGITVLAEEGAAFEKDFAYVTKEPLSKLPSTIEATVKFPANTPLADRGGVVFGNYKSSDEVCVNFEIHQCGNPRLYYVDEEGRTFDYKFETVNVYTGEWVHVAMVKDTAANTVSCYVNGELQETKNMITPASLTFKNPAVIGGDMRAGNSQYFKGSIRDLALYTDIRTADEIAADYQATEPDKSDLMGYYCPTTAPEAYKDPYGIGPDFVRTSRELFIKDYESVTDYDYAFAVIGDIQTLTYWYPDNLHYIYDWIVENAEEKKIAFVSGLGDITDKDNDYEWELAKAEMSKLDGVVPYSFVRGNHDSTGQFKNYFPFEEYSDTVDGYLNDTMLNTYHKLKVGGVKYLFLNLDLAATDTALEWADKVIREHKDYNVIITTHIYMGSSGKTFDDSSSSSLTRYGMNNFPDVIWDRLVSRHENISMVLCGHAPTDRITVNQRQGVHGNTVTEVLVDPQTTDKNHESTGLVAMLYFSDGGKTVDVEYYSTIKEAYFLRDNQFRMTVDVVPSGHAWVWIVAGAAVLAVVAAVAVVLIRKKKQA